MIRVIKCTKNSQRRAKSAPNARQILVGFGFNLEAGIKFKVEHLNYKTPSQLSL
jgi:hypothetical protein